MSLRRTNQQIDRCLQETDFVSARKIIDEHLAELTKNKHVLSRSVREMVETIEHLPEIEERTITPEQRNIILAWNSYAANFDVRSLRVSIQNYPQLLLQTECLELLSEDAKVLLASMSAVE